MDDISAWITPFTFLPGVGLLILSTVNRFHNVNNLIRAAARDTGIDNNKPGERKLRLRLLLRRSRYFHLALTSLYVSLAAFSIAALSGKLALSWLPGIAMAADMLTTFGVVCVVFSSWQLIRESTLSFRMIREHEEEAEKA